MKKFTSYLYEEKNVKGDVLIIVDVQKEFDKWFSNDFVKKLDNYAKNFNEVYQIWDAHKYDGGEIIKINKPTWKFNNQKNAFRKVYGTSASSEIKELGEKALNLKKNIKEGDMFKVNDNFELDENGGRYIVRIDNNHKWFYVNENLSNLFNNLKKQNKSIVLTGGAEDECLYDVLISMKSLGLNVQKNDDYVYSANSND